MFSDHGRIGRAALLGLALAGAPHTIIAQQAPALPEPPPDKAMMVIVRAEAAYSGTVKVEFRINGQLVAVLGNNTYTHLLLEPGVYPIEGHAVGWLFGNSLMKPVAIKVVCEEAQRCCVRYTISRTTTEIVHRIAQVAPETGEKGMISAIFDAPKSVTVELKPTAPVPERSARRAGDAPSRDLSIDDLKQLLGPEPAK